MYLLSAHFKALCDTCTEYACVIVYSIRMYSYVCMYTVLLCNVMMSLILFNKLSV